MTKVRNVISVVVIFFIVWLIVFIVNSKRDSDFIGVEIPQNLMFEKPKSSLTNAQIDSVKQIEVKEDKIVVVGDGYSGYDFYIWHQPADKGQLWVRATELTNDVQLSKDKLSQRTKIFISKSSEEFELFTAHTVIDEGTFDHFYPVRFELWFKPEVSGKEKKLTESYYIIDGWDR